jgi:hypothetical protein
MAYQVVKGWPSEGAIDELFSDASGVDCALGSVAAIDADGNITPADYNVDGSDAGLKPVFIIDKDTITDKKLGLMHKILVEVDAEHYEAGTYEGSQAITATGGKFDVIADTGDSRPVVGVVRSFDATTGKMRVLMG